MDRINTPAGGALRCYKTNAELVALLPDLLKQGSGKAVKWILLPPTGAYINDPLGELGYIGFKPLKQPSKV